MNLYLASGYSWRPNLLNLKQLLEAQGHVVVSRWLRFIERPERYSHDWQEFALMVARENLEDLQRTEGLIVDSRGIRKENNGGVHTELGFALARNLPIFLIGERGNTFHWLPQVCLIKDEGHLLKELESAGRNT